MLSEFTDEFEVLDYLVEKGILIIKSNTHVKIINIYK